MVIAYVLESSLFDSARYDTKRQELSLALHNGRRYSYNLPAPTFCAFLKSDSKGAFFNQNIRPLPFTRQE